MNDKINSLSPKRKTGQLYKMKEDIERLKAKLMGKNELEQALQQTISLITEQKKEYNRLIKSRRLFQIFLIKLPDGKIF